MGGAADLWMHVASVCVCVCVGVCGCVCVCAHVACSSKHLMLIVRACSWACSENNGGDKHVQ